MRVCVLQQGQAPLSDLQCTTSSEALLAGKAPTFRLLVWAIDRQTGGRLCVCLASWAFDQAAPCSRAANAPSLAPRVLPPCPWNTPHHAGNHLPHVTYVVSESFVVATKRVKHAIKSDIPSIGDHISKLVHIGKATVDKLQVRRDGGWTRKLSRGRQPTPATACVCNACLGSDVSSHHTPVTCAFTLAGHPECSC